PRRPLRHRPRLGRRRRRHRELPRPHAGAVPDHAGLSPGPRGSVASGISGTGGSAMHEHIAGIVPPMTTPFRADDTLDEDALRAERRSLIGAAGAHGLAVGGSTGEGHALTTAEIRRATVIVVDEARGRVPVIAGVITDSTASAIERGRAVRD